MYIICWLSPPEPPKYPFLSPFLCPNHNFKCIFEVSDMKNIKIPTPPLPPPPLLSKKITDHMEPYLFKLISPANR